MGCNDVLALAKETENMPLIVIHGATLKCSFGNAPCTLTVPPVQGIDVEENAIATIQDAIPMTNIAPFGACMSPANPQVAAATAAALGVLTPQPCLPAIAGPWAPGSSAVTVNEVPAVTSQCRCTCNWGGIIEVAQQPERLVELG
jgi:hypothetical protein